MKRVMRIMQSHWIMLTSEFKAVTVIYLVVVSVMAVIGCSVTNTEISRYINENQVVDFSGNVQQMINTICFSSIIVGNMFRVKGARIGKRKDNYNLFLRQLPINKKDITKSGFIVLNMVAVIPLFRVLDFIVLNLFKGSKEYVSAYSGTFVLLYLLWYIFMSICIFFSVTTSKKYRVLKFLDIIFMLILVVFEIYITSVFFSHPQINETNMYNALGSAFAPILKGCIYIGGIYGIVLIIASFVIGYFLCCKLSLSISEEE